MAPLRMLPAWSPSCCPMTPAMPPERRIRSMAGSPPPDPATWVDVETLDRWSRLAQICAPGRVPPNALPMSAGSWQRSSSSTHPWLLPLGSGGGLACRNHALADISAHSICTRTARGWIAPHSVRPSSSGKCTRPHQPLVQWLRRFSGLSHCPPKCQR